ncbi:MAG: pentapeptide repeat-containing protein [Sulfitobacter sp.]
MAPVTTIILAMLVILFAQRTCEGLSPSELQSKLGGDGFSVFWFWVAASFWGILFLLLFGGLVWTVVDIIVSLIPSEGQADQIWSWRFSVLKLASLTAVLGAVVALPFTLVRLGLKHRQTLATEAGLVTDRFNKAVDALGANNERSRIGRPVTYFSDASETNETSIEWQSEPFILEEYERNPVPGDWQVFSETLPSLDVRIGGLFALERIARDNADYHLQVVELICAYIRGNSPQMGLEPSLFFGSFNRKRPRQDIQTAITILGRRPDQGKQLEAKQKFRVDLRFCDLSGADFSNGDFSASNLTLCRLEGANFVKTMLHGTRFTSSLINFSDFFQADLKGARFDQVVLSQPKPKPGSMNETILSAKLYGVSFQAADLSAVDYIGDPDQLNLTFGTKDTQLHEHMEEERIAASSDIDGPERKNFKHWSPYNSNDSHSLRAYQKFLEELALTQFPYVD